MDKIKVMHVLNTGGYSGAENVVITMINNMRSDVDSYYVSPRGNIETFLDRDNINYFPISGDKLTVRELRKAIKDIKPDIIHAHDFTAGIVSSLSTFGIPIINHIHNNGLWIRKVCPKSMVYFISTIRYKTILTVSDSVIDEYVFGSLCRKKARTVGNPIDISSIKRKAETAVIQDSSDIIFLGRLSEPKNPLMFIRIINELIKSFPYLKAVMVGDGELRDEVENAIKANHLDNNVLLYGFQENPYGILKNSKVLCMPSKWEGFGLAAIEAMSLGIPVVASRVGGLTKIVTSDCGELCDSLTNYSEEISRMLTDENYYSQKQNSAYQRALSLDNLDSYTFTIKELYYNLLGATKC